MGSRLWVVVTGVVVLALPGLAGARNDPVRTGLDKAKVVYAAEVDKYRAAVGSYFDRREETARKAGDKKLVDQVKAERLAFEDRGEVPRAAPVALKTQLASARGALETSYKAAIREYTKGKRDDDAAAAEKEFEEFKAGAGVFALTAARWADLFNGRDTTGWARSAGSQSTWAVEKGVLVGSGPGGLLVTTKDSYDNFHLKVEAMISDGGNSGVFFRLSDTGAGFKAYEAQINSTNRDPIKTGSLMIMKAGGFTCPVHVKESPVPPGAWFIMDVVADGPLLTVSVNGKKTAEYVDREGPLSRGAIALQQQPGTVASFRKVQLRELPAKR